MSTHQPAPAPRPPFTPAPPAAHPEQAGRLRVLMVSKALVVGVYQRKAEELAALGIDLTVVTPPAWGDARGLQPAEAEHTKGYRLLTLPVRLGGNFHLHHYPGLPRLLAGLRPQLLHMDEEPYNLATWHALRAAHAQGIPATFFTWQNLLRTYPPPFRQMEAAVYRTAPLALAGSRAAADVLRAKGYAGELAVFPQFGVDAELFAPHVRTPGDGATLRMGYAGGLLPEKGVDLLLRAAARLPGAWTLDLIGSGSGSEREALEKLAAALGIGDRVRFVGRVAGSAMPTALGALDVLVLPSRTRPNWMEQFGRVLIEAMACGTAVVGSRSGEIPQVIGDAGLLFPEEDVDALTACLALLQSQPALQAKLAVAGRARVLAHFTMRQIAEATLAAYTRLLALSAGATPQAAPLTQAGRA